MSAGIRQVLESKRKLAIGICLGVILLSAVWTSYQLFGSGGASGDVPRMFFTVDDGKSFFPADSANLPPFLHEGKQALRARVYESANGVRFVNHVERYPTVVLEQMKRPDQGMTGPADYAARLDVKRPGEPDSSWVNIQTEAGRAVRKVTRPPDGASGPFEPVLP